MNELKKHLRYYHRKNNQNILIKLKSIAKLIDNILIKYVNHSYIFEPLAYLHYLSSRFNSN
jgi:hypothetical protein